MIDKNDVNHDAEYKELLGLITEMNVEDDAAFRGILEKLITLFDYNNSDIALAFSVSIPTVQRWRAGESCPHPLMRKSMYKSVGEILRSICTEV